MLKELYSHNKPTIINYIRNVTQQQYSVRSLNTGHDWEVDIPYVVRVVIDIEWSIASITAISQGRILSMKIIAIYLWMIIYSLTDPEQPTRAYTCSNLLSHDADRWKACVVDTADLIDWRSYWSKRTHITGEISSTIFDTVKQYQWTNHVLNMSDDSGDKVSPVLKNHGWCCINHCKYGC